MTSSPSDVRGLAAIAALGAALAVALALASSTAQAQGGSNFRECGKAQEAGDTATVVARDVNCKKARSLFRRWDRKALGGACGADERCRLPVRGFECVLSKEPPADAESLLICRRGDRKRVLAYIN